MLLSRPHCPTTNAPDTLRPLLTMVLAPVPQSAFSANDSAGCSHTRGFAALRANAAQHSALPAAPARGTRDAGTTQTLPCLRSTLQHPLRRKPKPTKATLHHPLAPPSDLPRLLPRTPNETDAPDAAAPPSFRKLSAVSPLSLLPTLPHSAKTSLRPLGELADQPISAAATLASPRRSRTHVSALPSSRESDAAPLPPP